MWHNCLTMPFEAGLAGDERSGAGAQRVGQAEGQGGRLWVYESQKPEIKKTTKQVLLRKYFHMG